MREGSGDGRKREGENGITNCKLNYLILFVHKNSSHFVAHSAFNMTCIGIQVEVPLHRSSPAPQTEAREPALLPLYLLNKSPNFLLPSPMPNPHPPPHLRGPSPTHLNHSSSEGPKRTEGQRGTRDSRNTPGPDMPPPPPRWCPMSRPL